MSHSPRNALTDFAMNIREKRAPRGLGRSSAPIPRVRRCEALVSEPGACAFERRFHTDRAWTAGLRAVRDREYATSSRSRYCSEGQALAQNAVAPVSPELPFELGGVLFVLGPRAEDDATLLQAALVRVRPILRDSRSDERAN